MEENETAAVRANTEYQKEGVEYCVTRRDMILMFRVTTVLSTLVVRRLFPFLRFKSISYCIKKMKVTFIYRLDEFASLCQQVLALCSELVAFLVR